MEPIELALLTLSFPIIDIIITVIYYYLSLKIGEKKLNLSGYKLETEFFDYTEKVTGELNMLIKEAPTKVKEGISKLDLLIDRLENYPLYSSNGFKTKIKKNILSNPAIRNWILNCQAIDTFNRAFDQNVESSHDFEMISIWERLLYFLELDCTHQSSSI